MRHASGLTFYTLLVIFLTSGSDAVAGNGENIDYVVAVVNDQAITWSELQSARVIPACIDPLISMSSAILDELTNPSDEVKRTVLDILIDRKLMLQEAERWGIPLARWHDKVTADMDNIERSYPSASAFVEALKKSELEREELQEWLRSALIIDDLIFRRFINTIDEQKIEQQAAQYFEQNRMKYSEAAEVKFQYVLVPSKLDEPLDQQAQAKQLAQEIYSRLQRGVAIQDFRQVGETSLEIMTGTTTEVVETNLGRLIVELERDAWSPPIRTPDAYLVAKSLGTQKLRYKPFSEVRQRIATMLVEKQVAQQMESWLEKQKETGNWRILNPALAQLQIGNPDTEP